MEIAIVATHIPVPALDQKLAQSNRSCPGPDAPKLQKRFRLLAVALNAGVVSVMEDVAPTSLHNFTQPKLCYQAVLYIVLRQ